MFKLKFYFTKTFSAEIPNFVKSLDFLYKFQTFLFFAKISILPKFSLFTKTFYRNFEFCVKNSILEPKFLEKIEIITKN